MSKGTYQIISGTDGYGVKGWLSQWLLAPTLESHQDCANTSIGFWQVWETNAKYKTISLRTVYLNYCNIYIWIQKITKHWCASAMYSICLASSWVACANGTSKCLSTSETKKISNLTVGCFWLSSSFWPWSLSSLRRGQEVQAPKWCRQSGTDPLLRPLDDTHMFNFRLKPWEIMFHNEYNESTSSRKHKEMGRSSKIFQKSWNISMSFSETAAGGGYLMPALSSSLSLVGMRHSKSFLLGWLLFWILHKICSQWHKNTVGASDVSPPKYAHICKQL